MLGSILVDPHPIKDKLRNGSLIQMRIPRHSCSFSWQKEDGFGRFSIATF